MKSGIKIFHAPISFKPDGSDNPNPNVGILAGCNDGKLFLKDSWNAQICEAMTPDPQDVIVTGKEFIKNIRYAHTLLKINVPKLKQGRCQYCHK